MVATAWAWELCVPGPPGKDEQPSGTSVNMDRNSHSALTRGLPLQHLPKGKLDTCRLMILAWFILRAWPWAVPHWCFHGDQPSSALEGLPLTTGLAEFPFG